MSFEERFKKNIFNITKENFERKALEVFYFQAENNPTYRQFLKYLGVSPISIQSLQDIPFLPIEFYKNHIIKTGIWDEKCVFKSSGTTSSVRSTQYVRDVSFYHQISIQIFQDHYGPAGQYAFLALLPSYLEQGESSLIHMVHHFSNQGKPQSGFYQKPDSQFLDLLASETPTILWGVTYALLDLCDLQPKIKNTRVVETGGMKGRKRELTRQELHDTLKSGLGVQEIHSEYGMTELTSQAYGINGSLEFPAWCKVLLREMNDPLCVNASGSGLLNIIDLANIDTCCFLATQDIASINEDGFQILGRADNSDIRGCSLLLA